MQQGNIINFKDALGFPKFTKTVFIITTYFYDNLVIFLKIEVNKNVKLFQKFKKTTTQNFLETGQAFSVEKFSTKNKIDNFALKISE